MHGDRLVFSGHRPFAAHAFRRCVARYDGNRYGKTHSSLDQYLRMAFAQLIFPESLRDIEACLRAQEEKPKWIKQRLHIKSFFTTSENPVKSQVLIAISVYVLVAVIKKRIDIHADRYTMLQIQSVTLRFYGALTNSASYFEQLTI